MMDNSDAYVIAIVPSYLATAAYNNNSSGYDVRDFVGDEVMPSLNEP
jgi:hypothetical protein